MSDSNAPPSARPSTMVDGSQSQRLEPSPTASKLTPEEFICQALQVHSFDLSHIPAPVRLNAKRKTTLDKVFDAIPKPRGYLPEKQLPAWEDYPLSKTLPTIPAPKDYLYFSRGNVGQPLHRPNAHYTVRDPYNHELVVSSSYTGLNDKNGKAFLKKPVVKEYLINQGLASKTNKAICTNRQFNKYRQYLYQRVYVEDVNDVLQDKDLHQKVINDIVLAAKNDKDITEGKTFARNERTKAAMALRVKAAKDRMHAMAAQEMAAEQRTKRFLYAKNKATQERRAAMAESNRFRQLKLDEIRCQRINLKAALVSNIATSDKANVERRAHDQQLVENARRQFQLEWMDAKFDYQKIMLAKQKSVNQAVDNHIMAMAQKRQDRVETIRSHMPEIIERRKAEHKRLWDIVRKYFNRWRENVQKRKERRPDAMHKSNWEIPEVIDKTLEYLRKESGYEKLDDFIMGIVALKKRIKAEIEAEERAEAEAAAAAERGSKSSVDPPSSAADSQQSKPPSAVPTSAQN